MKRIRGLHFLFVFACVATIYLAGCQKAPQGDNALITDEVLPKSGTGKVFVLDTANSWIRISATGVGKNHPGTLPLRYGKVTANNNQVTSGRFILDIPSLEMREQGAMNDSSSMPHLATGDVLNPAAFGTSQFEITAVEPYNQKADDKSLVEGANFTISGNLQIRSVTKNITFPARVDLDGNTLTAKGNFDVDRKQWELNYGETSTLDDKSVSETVTIEFRLEARPEDPQAL